MAKILEGVSAVYGKISGLHGAGQYGFIYDKNGFQIAPAGMDAAGGATTSNSLGITGAAVGILGFPLITLNRQCPAAPVGNGADATDDVLFTFTLPAATLTRNGQAVVLRIFGNTAASAATKTLKINIGTKTYTVFASAFGSAATAWMVEIVITRNASKSQVINIYSTQFPTAGTGLVNNISDTATLDDTATIVCNCTGKSSASTASDITASDFKVDLEQF